MKYYILIIIFFILFSCDNHKALTVTDLKTGTFKTLLDGQETESIAVRDELFQFETYNGKEEVFKIYWKSNFEYILTKENPKNVLDSTDFVVKITGIHKKHYTFKAYYKGSKFTQKGKALKIKD